ncbi:hypothetical protein AGLY_008716 [Aphis glycines]|uniref:Ubiquitin-like protease family profile domain-containing protein n=1 Tax=Aphis glycines TaxID=307491 RepID=A0A6G0TJF6_APHGL|nr:hypothetical protein AGLY_008716 [Aphis glycines]
MKDGIPVNEPDDDAGRYVVPPIKSVAIGRNESDPNTEDLWLFDMASTANISIKQGVDYETDVAVTKKIRKIQVKRPCILILDSLSGGVHRARITATLRDWLKQEYIAKYNGKIKDFSPQAIKGALVKLSQQPNYTHCGLFVIHFFKRGRLWITLYRFVIKKNGFLLMKLLRTAKKRRELSSIIISRMKERGSILPDDIKLPFLDFTDPENTRLSN